MLLPEGASGPSLFFFQAWKPGVYKALLEGEGPKLHVTAKALLWKGEAPQTTVSCAVTPQGRVYSPRPAASLCLWEQGQTWGAELR